MNVLITGAQGTVGSALVEHLPERYALTLLDRAPPTDATHEAHRCVVADITDRDALASAFVDQEAVVHLAGTPDVSASYEAVERNNVRGTHAVFEAAREAGVERVVFASSNHVVGMYEREHAPDLYRPSYDLTVDHDSPIRPDSHYGASKAAGEAWGRLYAERHGLRVYALRIGSVRDPAYDHPYGDAERGVERGEFDRDSDAYDRAVARMKCTWQSRRDIAQQVECCLTDDEVSFGVFYGVSDNAGSWFDLDRSRAVLGYEPRDDGSAWRRPPE